MIREYRISYAVRRADGTYFEDELSTYGLSIIHALQIAESILREKKKSVGWAKYSIWNAGLVAEADEEVC